MGEDERKRKKERRTRIEIIIALIVVVLLYLLNSCCHAAENQVWLEQKIVSPLMQFDKWGSVLFKAEQEEKFDEHHFIDSETLVMFGWKMNPYLSFYLGNRWVYERTSGKGTFSRELRPTFDVCLATPEFWTLKLDFRTRFEYRAKHGSAKYMRYRERLRIRTSWSVTPFRISPYVSEEVFFSNKPNTDTADLFDRNRAQIGVSLRPIPSIADLSCNIYYMAQHDILKHASSWTPMNIWGFEVLYLF